MSGRRRQAARRHLRSELGLRVASAAVLIVIVMSATWEGGLVFRALCCALAAVSFYEWQRMVAVTPFDMPEAILTAGFAVLLACAILGGFAWALVLFVIVGLVLERTRRGTERDDVRWIGLGALYCASLAVALPTIREAGGTGFGLSLMLFLFLVVWLTDIAAFFTGRSLGGPKLWPAVSPKKTWSGALGGLAAAMVVGALFGVYAAGFTVLGSIVVAALLSVCAQAGDFFESWVKRIHDVKDSSRLIPGHGGFLDRVDGLVAAAFPLAVAVAVAQ